MTLAVDIRRTLGAFTVEAKFDCAGGVTALFGRSGAGKTSIVQMIAGLVAPGRGRIAFDDTVLFDSAANIDVAPERRRVGYVFQDARLFPHMTVRRNLTYGARRNADRRGGPGNGPGNGNGTAPGIGPGNGPGNAIGFDAVVEILGIAALLERHPRDLSGGERQRVAIGRALLANPRLLLMDEPLASLDAERKWEIIPFIQRLRREFAIPIVYVSHAVDEVLRIADDMVLLADGRAVAAGPVEDVMNRPELARIAGEGDAGSVIRVGVARVEPAYGLAELSFAGGVFRVAAPDLRPGETLRIRVRARDVSLALDRPQNVSVLNIFRGTVTRIDDSPGPQVDIEIDVGGTPIRSRITRKSCDELGIAPGRAVYAMVKAVAIDRSEARR